MGARQVKIPLKLTEIPQGSAAKKESHALLTIPPAKQATSSEKMAKLFVE